MLVATDAAGEGLNLQRAHLMVNYDLPWNPNRIEQRFGRIHRIGQTEVCHLWNLVADDTREGEVFPRLLEQDRGAAQGLPAARSSTCSARRSRASRCEDLLIEAIRYGDRPEVRARLDEVIDATVGEGLDKLIAERAAHADMLRRRRPGEVARPDGRGERAAACSRTTSARSSARRSRSSAAGCPSASRAATRSATSPPTSATATARPAPAPPRCCARYERVTFDKNLTRPEGKPRADLLAPGHPLLDAVTDLIIERYGTLLKQGTMLVDRHDPGTEPRLLVAVTHEITDGHDPARTITKKFGFVEVDDPHGVRAAGEARYLDYEPMDDPERMAGIAPPGRALARRGRGERRARLGRHRRHARRTRPHPRPGHRPRRPGPPPGQAAADRRDQLLGHARMPNCSTQQAAGRSLKMKPETAHARARDLERRLEKRLADLDRDEELIARPPVISAAALVIPQGLLDKLLGVPEPAR